MTTEDLKIPPVARREKANCLGNSIVRCLLLQLGGRGSSDILNLGDEHMKSTCWASLHD